MNSNVKITPKNIVDEARDQPWKVAVEPFRIAPHLYYVGNRWVGSFLVETSVGLALIDTTVTETLYLLLESVRKLGFDPRDIRKIFLTHAHMDHDGAARALKELTGAEIYLSKEDDAWRRRQEADMHATGFKITDYAVDRFYSDAEPIIMGDVTVRTRLSAGHTPGTTSFFVTVRDANGKPLTWGMHGGVGINTMNADYLNKVHLPLSLQDTFLKGCEDMKAVHVDICTPSHPAHSDMLERIPKDRWDYTPFVDETKWPKFLEERKKSLLQVIEQGVYNPI